MPDQKPPRDFPARSQQKLPKKEAKTPRQQADQQNLALREALIMRELAKQVPQLFGKPTPLVTGDFWDMLVPLDQRSIQAIAWGQEKRGAPVGVNLGHLTSLPTDTED